MARSDVPASSDVDGSKKQTGRCGSCLVQAAGQEKVGHLVIPLDPGTVVSHLVGVDESDEGGQLQ